MKLIKRCFLAFAILLIFCLFISCDEFVSMGFNLDNAFSDGGNGSSIDDFDINDFHTIDDDGFWHSWYKEPAVTISDIGTWTDAMYKLIKENGMDASSFTGNDLGLLYEKIDDPSIQEKIKEGFDYVTPIEKKSAKSNASGTKITSNAHSRDFPGMVFTWGDTPAVAGKQKEDGWLKVHWTVFQNYLCFVITAKESSNYYDYLIMPYPGQKRINDCYIFHIPTHGKNINMVFLNAFQKKINLNITKPENPDTDIDPPGPYDDFPTILNPPHHDASLTGGGYAIISHAYAVVSAVVDEKDAWMVNGKPIKKYWEDTIVSNGYGSLYKEMTDIICPDSKNNANWIWDRGDKWRGGISGWNSITSASRFYIDGSIVESSVPFYFACNNAAVVYVNGQRVGYTSDTITSVSPPVFNYGFGLNDFGVREFGGNAWARVYKAEIRPYLIDYAYNEIIIIAASSDNTGARWNPPKDQKPVGLIFSCQFTTK